jgi:NitT/TauT family transport system ATP-binding protein
MVVRLAMAPAISSAVAVFQDVSFRYPSRVAQEPVLVRFDLEIRSEEFFVLLGPSGCGKTTALNILAGFVQPTSGRCLMNGEEVRKPGRDRAVIFQGDDSLFYWLTVYQNVEFPLELAGLRQPERSRKVKWALDLVNLGAHASKYPRELSGGMKQRLQIARALVTDASVLLMDEPFGALDALTRSELQDQLVEIWSATRRTILFITHDISEAVLLATRLGIMSHGPAATLRRVIQVDLTRPRRRGDPAFGHLYDQIGSTLSPKPNSDES